MTALASAKAAKFEISLDKGRIAIGETAQLALTFYDTQSMPAPDIGNIDGLEIRYVGPSSMMTVLNGQVSTSISHMYTVLPLRTGKFQIGSFSFKYKGDEYTSNTVLLEATEEKVMPQAQAPVSPPEQINLEDRIFLTLTVDKTAAYVNELIPVTVKLYVNRLNVSDIQLPTFSQEGFSKIEFKEPKQFRENVGDVIYDVLEFKTNIFGTMPGDYRLGPAKIKCNLVERKVGPRGNRDDFFGNDSLFEDFLTRYEKHPIELKSRDVQLIISPLPTQGRPKDFSGAVGDYQFIFEAGPTKVKVGDPIMLRMTINGTGNFNTVFIPKLDDTAGFKVYEPEIKTEDNRKSFKEVLIPETDKVKEIPRAVFNYFDTNKKEYRTITQGPVAIQVEKGKEEAPSQVVGPIATASTLQQPEELARDIIYIKESPGKWREKGYEVYRKKSILMMVPLPFLFLAALYALQWRMNRMRRDAVYAGRIAASRLAKKGIKDLRHQMKTGDPKVFYENLFNVLQSYLGNKLNIPPAGITRDVADSILVSRQADPEISGKVRRLFDTCDEARFAFSQTDATKTKDDLNDLEEVIRYFERRKI